MTSAVRHPFDSLFQELFDKHSVKVMEDYKGTAFPSMGCRSWLTPDTATENLANANNWVKGKKYYGRLTA